MPRKPRFFLPDVPNHVVQRGRNREPVFFESSDYYFYLEKLREALHKYGKKGAAPFSLSLKKGQ